LDSRISQASVATYRWSGNACERREFSYESPGERIVKLFNVK